MTGYACYARNLLRLTLCTKIQLRTKITLNLPPPISVNQIWRQKRGGTYISKPYQDWIRQAGLEWLTQKKGQPRKIEGNFKAVLILAERKSGKGDLDNFVKCVLDFAVKHQLVSDDRLCRALYVRWGTEAEAPMGCRLTLKSA
jgi:Holliday junction resolvase RusA-like endonuclease